METALNVVLILAIIVVSFDVGYFAKEVIKWSARRKETQKAEKENASVGESTEEDDDEFLIGDSPVERIVEEIEEHQKCLSSGHMSKEDIEEHITSLQVAKTLLAIHAEEYEDCLNLYADTPEVYLAIKEAFNDYRIIATRLDTKLDFLIEEYTEQREDIEEMIGVKRCGFHEN